VIGVFIVAPSAASRAHLRSLVLEAGLTPVGSARDLAAIDDTVLDSEPDILLIDRVSGPPESERADLMEIAGRSRVVLLVDRAGQRQIVRAFQEGAWAVLPRELSAPQLRAALGAVVAGLIVAHPSAVRSLAPSPALETAAPSPPAEPLTKRELQVLEMLAAGLLNKEIAARLGISEHTAKFHVASILGKLGAATRTEAVTIALRHGLLLL
jgi:DNA-binding NarL/FixJ family response regulator